MKKEKSITFDDIAKYTGFSKTTISRYFNHPESVLPRNREIISNALSKLDYKENKVAKVLANGESELIGVILPDLQHQFYSEVLSELLATYPIFGYKFLIFNGDRSEHAEARYIKELMAYRIEGLIILSHTMPSSELSKLSLPLVAIEREDKHISSVSTDNYNGAQDATNLLIDKGSDILLHINSYENEDLSAYSRTSGFVHVCKKRNMPHEVIYLNKDHTDFEEAPAKMSQIFETIEEKHKNKRKGIFLSNDTYANMLINCIFRKYGHLPDDYQIVGFGNSSISRDAVIPISTVAQQTAAMAKEALLILNSQMQKSRRPVHKRVPAILIERDTTQ